MDKNSKKALDFVVSESHTDIETLEQWIVDLKKLWFDVYRQIDYFGFYDDHVYCYEAVKCFADSTIHKIDAISEVLELQDTDVLDYGAGVGLSTVYLKEKYGANALFYNIGEKQQKVLEHLDINKNIPILNKPVSTEVFCAFDVFEHFKNPISELMTLMVHYSWKYLVFNNAFTFHDAIGHYEEYEYMGKMYSGEEMRELFKQHVIGMGYSLIMDDEYELTVYERN